jgi:hypothetical protein
MKFNVKAFIDKLLIERVLKLKKINKNLFIKNSKENFAFTYAFSLPAFFFNKKEIYNLKFISLFHN